MWQGQPKPLVPPAPQTTACSTLQHPGQERLSLPCQACDPPPPLAD